jgi:hypothetical protein
MHEKASRQPIEQIQISDTPMHGPDPLSSRGCERLSRRDRRHPPILKGSAPGLDQRIVFFSVPRLSLPAHLAGFGGLMAMGVVGRVVRA